MVNKFFISYATPDKKIAQALQNFIYGLEASTVDVFMSGDSTIQVGGDFNQIIMKALDESCCFIPLLSAAYFNSRYCMIELGAACVYYYSHGNNGKKFDILPAAIPPAKKEKVLQKTPLNNLQVIDITNVEGWRNFFNILYTEHNIMRPGYSKIQDLIKSIEQALQVPTLKVEPQVYYDTNVMPQKKEDVVQLYKVDMSDNVRYNFKPDPSSNGRVASFVSCAYLYPNPLNLNFGTNVESVYALYAHITHTQSLHTITIEMKSAYANCPPYVQTFKLKKYEDNLYVRFDHIDNYALSRISEICFVVHPEDSEEFQGNFSITELCVKSLENIEE